MKKAEEIFNVLDEHMGMLSMQKTTLFYESFKHVIEQWDQTLQQILETLETLIGVQRQWLYLESIFASQQNDQDKQLIGDISKFQAVNSRLSYHMGRIYEDKNVKKALCVENFHADLMDMWKKLEESQKILFQLLERKRKEFPRFYFLSNDDLFELLGNSKDPFRVNRHIKKCFEGIKKLDIQQAALAGRGKASETFEVSGMMSPDDETVKFQSKVPCELGVESWLKNVEKMMRETLKQMLLVCHTQIRRKDGMRWVEKWIASHPGMLLITACQIFWTTEIFSVISSLYNNEKQDKTRAWKFCRDEKKAFIEELTRLVRKPGNETERNKLVALITIEVHSRDIIEHLYKVCNSPNSFDWMKQLRFYHTPGVNSFDCNVEQTTGKFPYGFEYQGMF